MVRQSAPHPGTARLPYRLAQPISLLLLLLTLPGGSRADVVFHCPPETLRVLPVHLEAYLAKLKIPPGLYAMQRDAAAGLLNLTLTTPPDDTSTLDLAWRPALDIHPARVRLPDDRDGKTSFRTVLTASRKEIVLALLQHGRITHFSGNACALAAFDEHVGLRQNIAAWAEKLEWRWPEGGDSRWNRHYWRDGSPRDRDGLRRALADAFANPRHYAIGCYTATKLIVAQGVLDYYRRVRPDPGKAHLVEARLLADREPLADIEDGGMWRFDPDFKPEDAHRPGKLLRTSMAIAAKNFVPGDWPYFLNTDLETHSKTGYEGSNPIYLGRNRFADYYNDHRHAYTFEQKLDQVYQWRHGVFSERRDHPKRKPLSAADFERLGRSPNEGGLLPDQRSEPYFFGFESLPAMPGQDNEAAREPISRPPSPNTPETVTRALDRTHGRND